MYLTAIWYQDYKHESPIQNVLHVLTAPIAGMGVCLLVPVLAPRVRAPILLIIGGLSNVSAFLKKARKPPAKWYSAACWLYAFEPPGTSYWACEFISNIVNPFGADL